MEIGSFVSGEAAAAQPSGAVGALSFSPEGTPCVLMLDRMMSSGVDDAYAALYGDGGSAPPEAVTSETNEDEEEDEDEV